jgi:hypothetical protein
MSGLEKVLGSDKIAMDSNCKVLLGKALLQLSHNKLGSTVALSNNVNFVAFGWFRKEPANKTTLHVLPSLDLLARGLKLEEGLGGSTPLEILRSTNLETGT